MKSYKNNKSSKNNTRHNQTKKNAEREISNDYPFHCPICNTKFASARSCSLHFNSCLGKHNSQKMTSSDSLLHKSILYGRNQSISVLNKGIIYNDTIPIQTYEYKRQKFGINELNRQFQPIINNPFNLEDSNIAQNDNSNQDNFQNCSNDSNNDTEVEPNIQHPLNSSIEEENQSSNESYSSSSSIGSNNDQINLSQQMRLLELEEINTQNSARGFTNDYIVGFNLMKILNKANSPLYLYDEIMRWATESRLKYSYEFNTESGSSSRHKLRKFAYDSTSSEHLKPKPKYVMVGKNRTNPIEVITFDTIGMIHSLLSNPNLMKDENLLFQGDTPYLKKNPSTGLLELPHILGDINSGTWYKKSCESLCQEPIDVLCPIILFIDGLTIDQYSNLQLEPVTFTLGIFNRETRNKAEAWKTLGFINNMNHNQSYINELNIPGTGNNNEGNQSIGGVTSLDKLTDYHTILDAILEDLREIQESGGLLWNLEYKGVTHQVRFKFPIQFVVGDCKGHNFLCGRFGSHNNTHSLCRDCDVLLKNSDNVNVTCRRITEDRIVNLIDSDNEKSLKKLSYHNLKNNAFRNICFGGDPCGIYGATLPELLHVLRITLTSHAITAFSDRANRKQLDQLHLISTKLGIHGAKQSDRNFFKIKFSQAITDLTKLDGDHKLGSVFLLFLSLYSTYGLMNFCADYSVLKLLLPAVEQLLIFHEWAMSDEHQILDLIETNLDDRTADVIEDAQFNLYGNSPAYKAIKRMMTAYKDGVQRTKGNGFQFPKFHQLLHSVLNILRHGSMRNFDGARCEGIGKTNAKEPSRRTQKNTKTILEQTGLRYIENCIFDKCISDIEIHMNKLNVKKGSNIVTNKMESKRYGKIQGSSYRMYIDNVEENGRENIVLEWMSDSSAILDYGQSLNAAQFAFNYLHIGEDISELNVQELNFRTEYVCPKGNIYRSHPSYRSEGPWHDWVYLKWEIDQEEQRNNTYTTTDIIPARIYGIIEITESMQKNENNETETGVWLIVSSLCLAPINNGDILPNGTIQQSFLDNIQIAKKWKIDCNEAGILKFWLVHVDNIVDTAFVLPDINENGELSQEHVIVVKPRNKWKDLFIKECDRNII